MSTPSISWSSWAWLGVLTRRLVVFCWESSKSIFTFESVDAVTRTGWRYSLQQRYSGIVTRFYKNMLVRKAGTKANLLLSWETLRPEQRLELSVCGPSNGTLQEQYCFQTHCGCSWLAKRHFRSDVEARQMFALRACAEIYKYASRQLLKDRLFYNGAWHSSLLLEVDNSLNTLYIFNTKRNIHLICLNSSTKYFLEFYSCVPLQ